MDVKPVHFRRGLAFDRAVSQALALGYSRDSINLRPGQFQGCSPAYMPHTGAHIPGHSDLTGYDGALPRPARLHTHTPRNLCGG